uniref:Uncharacterized protein n=1 Tax=Panagrolaimus sp. ES5 TaxID=591445 RepID=A0AC34GH94_9BILA
MGFNPRANFGFGLSNFGGAFGGGSSPMDMGPPQYHVYPNNGY